MRMEKTGKLLLNCPVFQELKYQTEGEKHIRLLAFHEGKPTTFLIKAKSKADASAIVQNIEELKKKVQ
jgi:hypothetical protein